MDAHEGDVWASLLIPCDANLRMISTIQNWPIKVLDFFGAVNEWSERRPRVIHPRFVVSNSPERTVVDHFIQCIPASWAIFSFLFLGILRFLCLKQCYFMGHKSRIVTESLNLSENCHIKY